MLIPHVGDSPSLSLSIEIPSSFSIFCSSSPMAPMAMAPMLRQALVALMLMGLGACSSTAASPKESPAVSWATTFLSPARITRSLAALAYEKA